METTIKVKVIKADGVQLPEYATIGSAGMDIRAYIKEPITLESLERRVIPSGIKVEIPEGYEIQIRPRSGMVLKHGISIPNAPSTIDSDFRGEIGIMLINLSKESYTIQPNERVAQIILNKVERIEFVEVETLEETTRGAGGYGHTGIK